jgi:hypothetical protein
VFAECGAISGGEAAELVKAKAARDFRDGGCASQYRFVADQQQAPETSSRVRNCIFIACSAALGSARLEKQTSNAETKWGLLS